jgi:Serine dehydrogenase proteinase
MLVFVVLSPVVQLEQLDLRRYVARRRLGRRRGTYVVTLIHRMETLALVGVPVIRFMSLTRADEVARALAAAPPGTPIDLIVHMPDGVVVNGEQIAAAMATCGVAVTVVVPRFALGDTAPVLAAAQHVVGGPRTLTNHAETEADEADAELLRQASALLDLYPQPPRRRPALVFVPLPSAQRRDPADRARARR